jgi:hypothetical protein
MAVTYDTERIRRATGADVPLQMQVLCKCAMKGVSPHLMYIDGKATYDRFGLSESTMVTQFTIDLLKQSGYSSKKPEFTPLPGVAPIAMTEQQRLWSKI